MRRVVSLGKPITFSTAPSASYPAYALDVIASADSDWQNDAANLLGSRAMAQQNENFAVGYAGWTAAADVTFTATLDLGSALHADRLILKGYYGTDVIHRPKAILLEYSDNGSSWNTHTNLNGLTASSQPGARNWWVEYDVSASDHRYWRVTFTHTGGWTFLSTFEMVDDTWKNLAEVRSYTMSPTVDGFFPDNLKVDVIRAGGSDWSTSEGGKLTNSERGYPAALSTGVGWALSTSGTTGTARLDLGSAIAADHVAIHGINGNGGSMVTPSDVVIEYSDNDTDWTEVFNKSSLTVEQNNKGRWIARVDVSEAGSHRYWRVIVTRSTSGTYLALTQFEVWQHNPAEGGGPTTYDETGLAFTITSTVSVEDVLHLIETDLAFTINGTVSATDVLHMVEALGFTINGTISIEDVQHMVEALSVNSAATVSVADVLHMREGVLPVEAAATVTGTDQLTFNEALAVLISATVTADVAVHLKEDDLAFVIDALVGAFDFLGSEEIVVEAAGFAGGREGRWDRQSQVQTKSGRERQRLR